MYIHENYSISNEKKTIKEYKGLLKGICKLNLRRTSKFNALAILGAVNCIKEIRISDNTGIYVCSEYASINSVKKVIESVSFGDIIMPFDFLNINSNNVSFYVSQALDSKGKNMLLSSDELSFEKGLETALFDLEINEVDDALVGFVDESLSDIENYSQYISNTNAMASRDYSGWLYINKIKEKSLAKITSVDQFNCLNQLEKIIANIEFDILYTMQDNISNINKKSLDGIPSIIDFINSEYKKMVCIKSDNNNKGYIVVITK